LVKLERMKHLVEWLAPVDASEGVVADGVQELDGVRQGLLDALIPNTAKSSDQNNIQMRKE